MSLHFRIARPVRNLEQSVDMYRQGLGLMQIGHFVDHEGFDGVMLGFPICNYHLEFTHCHARPVSPMPTPEDLFVFYIPTEREWVERCEAMLIAGFREVKSFNPYWELNGRTFEDPDGYRTVLQRASWANRREE